MIQEIVGGVEFQLVELNKLEFMVDTSAVAWKEKNQYEVKRLYQMDKKQGRT